MNQNSESGIVANVSRAYKGHRKIGNVLMIGAFYAMAASGGGVDTVHDGLQRAGSVVTSVYDNVKDPTPLEDRVIDDIPFEEFSEKAQQEMREEEQAEEAAYKRVGQTMSDLDGHRYDAIRQRGDAFREQHKSEIMADEDKEQTLRSIGAAETPAQALAALDTFMGFYGKDAVFLEKGNENVNRFDDSVKTEAVQSFATDVVSAFAPLPKQIIAEGKFKLLRVGTQKGMRQGQYETGGSLTESSIDIPVGNTQIRNTLWNGLPNSIATPVSTATTMLHELDHTQDDVSYGVQGVEDASMSASLKASAAELISRPIAVTPYAASMNYSERRAETFAFITAPEVGLYHPDEARRFGSEASKDMIKRLAGLDRSMPGFADYIVSRNDRLMQNPSIIPYR